MQLSDMNVKDMWHVAKQVLQVFYLSYCVLGKWHVAVVSIEKAENNKKLLKLH